MLFRSVGGSPVPQLPWGEGGKPLQADDRVIFNLDQASRFFDRPPEFLKDIYLTVFRDVIGDEKELFASVGGTPAGAPAPATADTPGQVAAMSERAPEDRNEAADSPAQDHRVLDSRLAIRCRALSPKFPKLRALEIEEFIRRCDALRLNEWCNDLIPKVSQSDDGERELKIITTVQCLRRIAMRSGKFLGETTEEFAGPDGRFTEFWPDNQIPMAARVRVYRLGCPEPITGIAFWQECVQYRIGPDGESRLDPFWDGKPRTMLGKCASGRAYRKAFLDELAGLYVQEEICELSDFRSSQARPGAARIIAERERVERDREPVPVEPVEITSPRQFDLALIDEGFTDPRARASVKGMLREELRRFHPESPEFYAAALRLVQRDPKRFQDAPLTVAR